MNPELMECRSCGKMFSNRAEKCPECGKPSQESSPFTCIVCQEIIPEDSTSCPECGDPNPFDSKNPANSPIGIISSHANKKNTSSDKEDHESSSSTSPPNSSVAIGASTKISMGKTLSCPECNLHIEEEELEGSNLFCPECNSPLSIYENEANVEIEQDSKTKTSTATMPHPWRRFFARTLDVGFLGIALIFIFSILIALLFPANYAGYAKFIKSGDIIPISPPIAYT